MTRNRILISALILSVVAAIYFATKGVANPPGVDGVIVAIDDRGKRIQVADHNTRYWFACTENTKITVNGYAGSFNQLGTGQRVRVVYDAYTRETLQVGAFMHENSSSPLEHSTTHEPAP